MPPLGLKLPRREGTISEKLAKIPLCGCGAPPHSQHNAQIKPQWKGMSATQAPVGNAWFGLRDRLEALQMQAPESSRGDYSWENLTKTRGILQNETVTK